MRNPVNNGFQFDWKYIYIYGIYIYYVCGQSFQRQYYVFVSSKCVYFQFLKLEIDYAWVGNETRRRTVAPDVRSSKFFRCEWKKFYFMFRFVLIVCYFH